MGFLGEIRCEHEPTGNSPRTDNYEGSCTRKNKFRSIINSNRIKREITASLETNRDQDNRAWLWSRKVSSSCLVFTKKTYANFGITEIKCESNSV